MVSSTFPSFVQECCTDNFQPTSNFGKKKEESIQIKKLRLGVSSWKIEKRGKIDRQNLMNAL